MNTKSVTKSAPAKPLKVGAKVTWTRRNGEKSTGKITAIDSSGLGDWYVVDSGVKNAPVISRLRRAALTLA